DSPRGRDPSSVGDSPLARGGGGTDVAQHHYRSGQRSAPETRGAVGYGSASWSIATRSDSAARGQRSPTSLRCVTHAHSLTSIPLRWLYPRWPKSLEPSQTIARIGSTRKRPTFTRKNAIPMIAPAIPT